jgi:drug/metabolite transporter (DMT)-like permease
MRPAAIAGIALIVIGAFVLIRGGGFTTKHDVLKVGDLKVSTSERQSIPPWAAGLGIAVGAALLYSGARRTR